jgi:hypothetical protein
MLPGISHILSADREGNRREAKQYNSGGRKAKHF